VGGRKKKGAKEETVGDKSESDGSGRGWLKKNSTMKVGPPRHIKVGVGVRREGIIS